MASASLSCLSRLVLWTANLEQEVGLGVFGVMLLHVLHSCILGVHLANGLLVFSQPVYSGSVGLSHIDCSLAFCQID